MSFRECVRIAFEGIRNNKMRSFLTMLGVIIGVGAVIAMVSIGEGAKQSVSAQIQGLGSNLLIVMPGRTQGNPGGPAGASGSRNMLRAEDAEAIQKGAPSVKAVSPEVSRSVVVKLGSKSFTTQAIGTWPEYPEVRNLTIENGRYFTTKELKSRKKVAVLGPSVVEELFGQSDPVGQKIKLGGMSFTVVGTTKSKGQSGFMNNDDNVFVPLSTAQARLIGRRFVRTIYVEAKDEKSMDLASSEISAVLAKRFDNPESFEIRNQAEILSAVQGTTQVFTLLLAAVAGISLLVGGIGIMNIMLVSVTERTREIGIRKAIGARRQDILRQFLVESMVLSTFGGAIGVLLGMLGSRGISQVAGWSTVVPLYSIVTAFGFAVAVGLFFGIYPAAKASRLNPIEALRYE
jgi:putative ABC transport system permease protein